MSQPESNTASTEAILKAMDDLGPADAGTIAEHSGVPYSTVVRKLRGWGEKGEIRKIERGSKAAHWSLLPTDEPLPDHLRPATADGDTDPSLDGSQEVRGQNHRDDAAPGDDQPATEGGDDTGEDSQASLGGAAEDDPDDASDDERGEDAVGESEDDSAVLTPATLAQAAADDDGTDTDTAGAAGPEGENAPDADEPAGKQETSDAGEEAGAESGSVKGTPSAARRPKSYFRNEGLALLRAHPDREFTIGQMCKLVAAGEVAAGAPSGTKVSPGAMANAMHKAAGEGKAILTREKPATFRAA